MSYLSASEWQATGNGHAHPTFHDFCSSILGSVAECRPSKQRLTGPQSFQAAHGTEVQSLWAVSCCFISVMYPTAGVWLMHRCCKAQLDRIQSNKTTKQTEECNSGRINIPCNLCQGYMFNSFPLYCQLFESHRVRADIFIALSV